MRLLAAVREADLAGLTNLLKDPQTGAVAWDRPCKYGTALHLAAYMGQRAAAEYLLQHGADVNARNDDGTMRIPTNGSLEVTEPNRGRPSLPCARFHRRYAAASRGLHQPPTAG